MPTSETLDHLTLEHLHTATLLLDSKRKIIKMNPAAETLLSRSAKRTIGKVFNQVCQFLDVSALDHLSKSNDQRVIRRDLTLERPHQVSIKLDMVVTPVVNDFAVVELYQRDEALESRQQDHTIHAHSENLLKGLAHEIKNPLGGIRGAAQLLEAELDNNELDEYTKVIIAEADRLTTLIDKMLGPKQQADKVWLNIHEVIDRVYFLLEAQAGKQIELIRDYDVSIPKLLVDQDQLVQAVLNIARNALEAIGDNQGAITLSTRVLRQHIINDQLHPIVVSLSVTDTGPGISHEHLSEIFYPMITNKPQGSGLGLSISQSLVKLNGGVLECTSRAEPTRFEILLPIGSQQQ